MAKAKGLAKGTTKLNTGKGGGTPVVVKVTVVAPPKKSSTKPFSTGRYKRVRFRNRYY